MQKSDIINVRRAVDANIAEGVITKSYPSIFTVRLFDDGDLSDRMVSYSYTDVLTKDVQLVICESQPI